ncbi:MAG: HEAT repeat domain-containing protein, partial [Longimicrobiales bacterium]|nr:HEAT repeat domain-containing protein [Longimicrobiales bacterium]
KERVIFGLSESEEPGAIDRLIEIARTETDPELRARAIFWLGNSNDERAADVLMEILSEPGGGGGR